MQYRFPVCVRVDFGPLRLETDEDLDGLIRSVAAHLNTLCAGIQSDLANNKRSWKVGEIEFFVGSPERAALDRIVEIMDAAVGRLREKHRDVSSQDVDSIAVLNAAMQSFATDTDYASIYDLAKRKTVETSATANGDAEEAAAVDAEVPDAAR